MIVLHQYPAVWGLSSLSPFCIKVELFLRAANIPYQVKVENNPLKGPKGKMPFIEGQCGLVADSQFIIQELRKKYSIQIPECCPTEHALRKMVEESLYFVLLFSRWLDEKNWPVIKREFMPFFPPMVGAFALPLIKRNLRRQAHFQGIGRHDREQIYQIGKEDLNSLESVFQGPYFRGDGFTEIDATVYSFLATIAKQPFDSPLKEYVRASSAFTEYIDRVDREFFLSSDFQRSDIPASVGGGEHLLTVR